MTETDLAPQTSGGCMFVRPDPGPEERGNRREETTTFASAARDRGIDTFAKGWYDELCPKWEIPDAR